MSGIGKTLESGGSPQLGGVFATGQRIFWCNTNRGGDQHGESLEARMRERGFAAAWIPFVHPEHMKRVRRGDLVVMYANGVGVIAIGVARESRIEILAPDHPDRLREFEEGEHEEEWRTPVEWIVWNERNPCTVESLRSSFQEITNLIGRVTAIRNHYLAMPSNS